MLPDKSLIKVLRSGIVLRPDTGWEHAADETTAAVAIGSRDARGCGRAVRTGAQRRGAHQLSHGAAGRRGPESDRDRLAGAPRARTSAHGPAPVPERGGAGAGAAPADRATLGRDAHLAGRIAAGDRAGPAHGRRRQRGVDHAAAGHLPGAGAAASPEPPPMDDLMPDPLLRDELPEDLPWLLRLLPRADVYLQDEVQVALHPTLTRVWCRKGRRGQRLVEAPANNAKEYGFGLVDWRDGSVRLAACAQALGPAVV